MEREARQKALAEKKRRLEEIKARRRQPASSGGGGTSTTTKTTTDGGSSGLDSYIDDLLNTTAPGLKGLQPASTDTTTTASSADIVAAVSKEESKSAIDIEKKEDEATPSSTENTTQPAPTQQPEPQTPKVETFEIAIQCMEDDFPPPSLVDEDEEKDEDDESSQDGASVGEHEQRGQSTSSIKRTASYEDRTSSTQQTSDITQPLLLSESEKEKLLSSQPFNTFLSTASKRVERLLGASDMNMYGILNGSGWGVTGTSSSTGDGSGVSGNGGGVVDFSVDYANDNEDDDEYYDDSDDELADGVSSSSSSTTQTIRRKKRRSKKKTKEEAYQTGGYFNARATYEFPKFTNGRNVTDIEWCPGHKEWVLASYNAVSGSNARDGGNEISGEGGTKSATKGMPSSNPTTRHLNPLDPSSSFLQTSSSSAIPNEGIVAIYNLSMPSRPEHLFCAGCPILHSQFHPTEHPKLILGGGSSGQVLVWDSRVGRYPVQRSANAVTGGGHDCELVGMKVLGNDNNTAAGGGGGAGGLSTSKLVTASSDGKVNYWSVSNLREPIEHVKVNANLSCLEVLHGNTNEGIVCGDERGGLHTILAGTGRDGSSSNKRIIRTLHPGGVIVTDDENAMDDADTSAATELAEMGHYGMVTSVATRPIMPPTGSTPRLGNKETTSELGGSSKGFSRGAGGLMVTTGVDWSTKLWAPSYTDAPLMSFLSNSYDYMCDAQWSPVHPSIFATASSNGTVNIWNLASSLDQPVSGTEGIPIDSSTAGDSSSSSSGLNRLQWSADGRRMAVASGDKLHVLGVGEEAWKSKGDEEGRTMAQLRSRGLIHEK